MPHKFDNSAASAKAVKKEVQARGLGVPQSTGESHDHTMFREAPAINDAPNGPANDMEAVKNNPSAGTDSAVRAAGEMGSMEIAGGAYTSNIAPEDVDRR